MEIPSISDASSGEGSDSGDEFEAPIFSSFNWNEAPPPSSVHAQVCNMLNSLEGGSFTGPVQRIHL
jgi:hypothetical protein